jgi:hypothetical protein
MIRNKKWLWLIIIFPLLMLAGFLIWAYTPLGPMPEALSALQSTSMVQVIDGRWLVFEPTTNHKNTGLIIYPGGRVDPRSYSPPAKQLSSSGYLVVIVPMPLNLAVFGAQRAGEVMNAFPDIENWVLAGHSLGGSMAARFTYQHQKDVHGLILWAAYPAEDDDLTDVEMISMSVFGTLDGLTTTQDIDRSRHLLPENVIWVPIEGGNHAQFGWYGDQPGDNPALISREEQQQMIIESTKNILDILED